MSHMYLITNDSINPYCAICKDIPTIFEYLQAISTRPLRAVNYKFGTKQKHRYADEPQRWTEVTEEPWRWKFLVGNSSPNGVDAYYVHKIDYIE